MSNSTIVKKSSLQFLLVFIFGLTSLSMLGQSRSCLRENCFDVVSFEADPVIDNGGAPLAVGTRYRFANAAGAINSNPAIDVLVTILELNNTSLLDIDVSADGLPRAFQPRISATTSGEVSALFRIQLVNAGTNTLSNSVCFYASPFDIDGGPNIQEFAELSLTDAYTRSANTQIEITRNTNVIRGRNINNQSAPVEPIDTSPFYTFSNYYENRNTFTFRIGKVGTGTQNNRFYALVLERAAFQNPVTVFVTQPLLCGTVRRDNGAPISGVTVRLERPDGTLITTTTTGADGKYQFNATRNPNLGSETFVIREVDPATDVPTGFALASVSDVDGANDNVITVTVNEASIVNNDFVDGPDFDRDGVADSVDLDDDNDGITDIDEGGNTANDDGDAFPNRIDRDADNDGCTDVIEGGFQDPDGDGQVGGLPVTVNALGLVTSGGGQTVNAAGNNYNVRPRDGNGNGTFDFREAGTNVAITSQPQNDTAFSPGNNSAQFSVTATGSNPVYRWQVSVNGGAFTNLSNGTNYSGVTTNTLSVNNPPSTFNGNLYRVVVTSSSLLCTSATSNSALLTVGSSLSITKNDRSGVYDTAGNEIIYDVVVTNTGNSTLNNIALSDNNGTLSRTSIATLAAGESVNLTSRHTITQADLNSGSVLNQITGSGTNTTGDTITDLSDDPGNNTNVDTNGNGNPDDVTVTPLVVRNSIALIKTSVVNDGADNIAQEGETITYSFTVTNTGTTTLTGITVTDPLLQGANGTLTGGPITLAPGASDSTTFTGTYTLQQSDINAGSRSNQATATGTPPSGPNVTDLSDDNSNLEDDPTVTTLNAPSSIAVIKTGVVNDGADNIAQAGETITYSFTITNTGATTLTNIRLTDPLLVSPNGSISGGPVASLAPGASTTAFTGTYTLQQSDINAGSRSNQATATGTPPSGADVTDLSDDDSNLEDQPTVTILNTPSSIALIKTSVVNDGADNIAQAGETITYSFTVTNTGTTTLTGITVTDPLLQGANGTLTGGPITLAPGASDSTTFTGTYTLQQSDINAGSRSNQATATGTPPSGPNVTDLSDDNSNLEDDPTVTTLNAPSSIAVIKTGVVNDGADNIAQAGETITYSFTITNTGATTLTNIRLTDPLLVSPNGSISGGPVASLAPGASTTAFTGTYTLQQSDINAGSRSNQATATGTPPSGADVTDLSDDDSNLEDQPTVTILNTPSSIALIKTSVVNDGADNIAQAGETITYSFTVTNTGTTTLTGITVTDPLLQGANGTLTGGPITLAPGASDSTTFTGTYTLQQSDINAGSRSNQATATGTPPSGPNVTDLSDDNSNLEDDPTVTTLNAPSSIAVIKTGVVNDGADNIAQAGETITYSFTITNTGATTLTNIRLTDPLLVSPNGSISGGPVASLAPGASTTAFTGTYTLQQSDINAGSRSNQATATGTPPSGADVTDLSDDDSNLEDQPTVTILNTPSSIALIKTSVVNDGADNIAQAGETITYSFTVTNTGTTTLTGITVTDPLLQGANGTLTGGPITLAPGASDSTTFTGTYTLQQSDINAGSRSNQATATGTPPSGPNVTDLSDDNSNLEDDPTVTTLNAPSSIAVIKTGVVNDGADNIAQAGETITYSFTITNTGATTLTNIRLTDPLLVSPNGSISGGPVASLAPGASTTAFTGTYTLQQSDINAGSRSNQATATGTPPSGADVTDLSDDDSNLEDQPTVTILNTPSSIALIKTSVVNDGADNIAQAGETITYSFTVTNTGTTTLTGITVTDPLLQGANGTLTGGPITLAPGASDSTTFTGTYTLQQSDINAGSRSNQATATGTPPSGPNVTDLSDDNSNLEDDPTVTTLNAPSSIAVIKTGVVNDGADNIAQAGETITYSFTITNTGATTLTNIRLTDPLLVSPNGSISGGPVASLAPGASTTAFTGTYTLQQSDINAGSRSNQATATGTPPSGADVTDLSDDDSNLEDQPTVTILNTPSSIALIKTSVVNDGADNIAQAGETITYSFTVTNTGTTTLTGITVTDPLLQGANGTLTGGPITLAPGASDSTTFTGTYTLQQSDINAGSRSNQATATGTPPSGPNVTDLSDDNSNLEDDPTVTTLNAPSSIAVIKTGVVNDGADNIAQAGETITYSFTITNTGATTLTNIRLTDPLLVSPNGSISGGPVASLAPGASTTAFTGTYTLQQSDINAGSRSNQATATGTPPSGADVTDLSDNNSNLENDPTVTTLPNSPSIAIVKIGVFEDSDSSGGANVGDMIRYSFSVRNTGNVTLTGISISDPLLQGANGTLSGGPITLEPGQTDNTTFSGTYTLVLQDVNDGFVQNQATATGTPPSGPNVTDLSDDNTFIEDDPTVTNYNAIDRIALIKESTFNDDGDGVAEVGETITYNFTVTNTGSTTLTNVTVSDAALVAAGGSISGGPIASLAPGAVDTTTFTGSYTITQADIDNGSFSNTALASGEAPGGDPTDPTDDITDTSDDNSNLEDDPTVTTLPNPSSIALIKESTFNDDGDGVAEVGETITYNFTVTNTGSTTLTNVTVSDAALVAAGGSISGGPIASLAPGAVDTTTFTGSYTITQADIDNGSFSNTALASGEAPGGDPTDPTDDITDTSDDNSNLEDDPTVTTLPNPSSIALIKESTFNDDGDGVAEVGETITYNFTVTNTGSTTLTNVTVSDAALVAAGGSISGGPIASLAPGAVDTTTFTGSYTITQADIDNGSFSNTALASGEAPGGDPTDPTDDITDTSDDNSNLEDDPTVTTLPNPSSIALIKESTFNDDGDGVAEVGETITYNFTVTNTGSTTLTNVTVSDAALVAAGGSISGGPIASLAPGAVDTTTFTGSYTITQADIDNGSFSNTALASGEAPGGDPTDPTDDITDTSDDNSNLEDDPTVTTLPNPSSIALIKESTFNDDGDGVAEVGETITYNFTVTNTGSTTLTNVTVSDAALVAAGGSISGGPIASLAPGAVDTTTFTGSYTITQADIDNGSFSNTALASGEAPGGDPTDPTDDITDTSDDNSNLEDDPTVTTLPNPSSIALIKESTFNDDGDGVAEVGETITYNFTVTNTGSTTLTNVTVSDAALVAAGGSISGGPIASLAPGAVDTTTFTGSYTITQADIDNGSFSNTALASGEAPGGDPTDPTDDITDTSDDNSNLEDDPTVTTLPNPSSIALIKESTFNDDGDGVAEVGETITYNFTVTNTGSTTLTNVTVSDAALVAAGGSISGGPIASLAPGAVDTTTFTGSYTITQADIDNGSFSNTALASGEAPGGDPTDPTDDITDTSDDNSNLEDDPTVTTLPNPSSIALIKESTFNDDGDGVAEVGETITYNFTVTNTGSTTLTNVTVSDAALVAAGGSISGGPIASLAPGAVDTTTFTGSYTITQADIDNGSFSNTALASGEAPGGDPTDPTDDITDTSDDNSNLEDDPTVTTLPNPSSIALIKESTFNDDGDGVAEVGETITYNFTVTNTGSTTLTNVTVSDAALVAAGGSISGGPIASLAPGAVDTTTFTGSYTITQADIDNGSFSNTALASGEAPGGDPTDPTDDITDTSDDNSNLEDDPTVTTLPNPSSIALIKESTFNDDGDGVAEVGETITYNFTVTNTGSTTLTNVTVSDAALVAAGGSISGGPIASLAPGAVDTTTFTGSYTITQADIDNGSFSNTALASGEAPGGDPTDPTDDITDTSDDNSNLEDDPTVTTLPNPSSIALIKESTFNDDGDGVAEVGETITYNFTVTNTGSTTLTNVTVSDAALVAAGGSISGGPIASLAPGAVDTTTFTGSYTITQADIDNGSFSNTALASGEAPGGDPTDPTDDITDTSDDNSNLEDDPTVTTLPNPSSIALIKESTFNDDGDGVAEVGETITYNFTVTNTGSTTLTNVTVSDAALVAAGGSISGGPIASLAPGAVDTTTFTGSYTITQADIDNGSFSNTALASGEAPGGDPTDPTDDITDTSDDNSNLEDDPTVTTLPNPSSIALIKESTFNDDGDGVAEVGETITYNFTVTNTGSTTLTNVTVSDAALVAAGGSISGGPIASLAPGAVDTTTFTGSYTITQADIDNGSFSNTALASGEAPGGDPTDPTDDITDTSDDNSNLEDDPTVTDLPQDPGSFSILKIADQQLFTQVGDLLTYTITVTNTGDVTLTNLILTDANADAGTLIPSSFASLAPGQTVSAVASRTITAQDVANTRALNSIFGTATNPEGDDVTDISDDPNNPDDIDQDGNGDPDDPTIVYIDSDDDGIPDPIDLDDDNDGITDVVELDGADPDLDNDNDGVPAYLDDDDNDFFVDNADGLVNSFSDLDGDGIANHLDLDVDDDGIYDVVETGNNDLDADNDGMVDGPVGTNGIPDAAEDGGVDGAGVSASPLESSLDSDTLPDYKDLDSDGDGIPDNVEAQSSNGYILPAGIDSDQNGVDDAYDTNGSPINPVNTEVDFGYANQDTLPDYLDLDSDGDNVPDSIEGSDFNADGIADITPTGNDSDNDGLDDAFDGSIGDFEDPNGQLVDTTPFELPNRDGLNDNPDFRDQDDDEDGLLTFEQGGSNNDPNQGEDVNNDGDPTNDDTDGDGTPNYLDSLDDTAFFDEDDDNDGIPDIVEVGSNPDIDNDGDGVPAYLDDDDNDPLVGNDDGVVNPEFDTDGDGISNHLDLDSDDDGIYDVNETGNSALDADNDGRVDGPEGVNGIPDAAEDGGIDGAGVSTAPRATDIDSRPDYLDQDSDNDGITDNVESQDTFGYIAPIGVDSDNNGVDDAYDTNGSPIEEVDFDGDGIQDYLDDDSDNDNVRDRLEGHDFNHDGVADVIPSGADVDVDGLDDAFDGDTSGYGDPDGLDLDGDPSQLPDLDGTEDVDYRDVDDDGDTVDTIYEDYDGDNDPTDQDTDGDGIPDYLDTNDDGDPFDTIDEGPDPDGDQNPNTGNTRDTDGDGIFDYLEFDEEIVQECGEPLVFNGISPDGDTRNDFLVIDQIECYPDNTLEIYNRWGVKVYDTDNYGANGQVFRGVSEGRITIQQNEELPVGTYYYIFKYIDLEGNGKSKAGYIYIQR